MFLGDYPFALLRQLELTRPTYLVSLLALLWIALYAYRSLVDLPTWQRKLSSFVRAVVIVFLALALAGLNLLRPTSEQFIVVAIDESHSVDANAQRQLQRYLTQLETVCQENSHKIAYLPFARTPGKVTTKRTKKPNGPTLSSAGGAPENGTDREKAETKSTTGERDKTRLGTNLAAAIETATAAVPPFYVPQVILISDGNETAGSAVSSALRGQIPIHSIPLPSGSEPEVQVSKVNVPAQVRQGEPFYVEVVVDSNHEDEGRIEIYRGDVKIDGQESTKVYKIKKGENRFRFRQEVTNQRLVNYSARISEFQDKLLDNNLASGLVSASGKPRVLLVDSDTKAADHLRWALDEQDIQVDVRPPEGLPAALSDLQNYDVVILSNVPATSLSIRQMEVIRTYVQDLGGGLIMLGGDQSFGLGGYYKTALEEILPVRSDFEKEKEKPSLAMVFVVDRSGSMNGQKLELAKEATKSAVDLLGPRDQVGVIAFDSNSTWVCELRSAADKTYVTDRVSTIQAGGGTAIYPGLQDALESLSSAAAKLKHVILLTDGHSAPGDFAGITSNMAEERITVSTVGVGQGSDTTLLESIAKQGNGRYYYCDDPSSIPQIFAKETVTASKSAINEEPFVPQVIRPTPVLSSLDIEAAPFLLGFVTTRPKPTSEFILATETGEPLLVWWRYGLGMTAAFTSDAKSQWAAEWLSWPDFSTFWAQVVRHCMRKSDAKGVYVEVERQGSATEIRLDAVDAAGRFRNNAETTVSVIRPNVRDEKETVTMQQVAPGRYVAKIETSDEGAYHFDLSQTAGAQTTFRQTRGLVVGYPDELRLRPTNESLLRRVSEVSGGQYTTNPADVIATDQRTVQRAQPLWPYLLTGAMLLFLADVALRRIDLSLLRGRT